MLARSFALCFWAPLGAAHPHDNHLLTSPALLPSWKVCLRHISRTTNETQRAATEVMITTPKLASQPARRLARRRAAVTCVMRRVMTRPMTRPTSTVALATTRHMARRRTRREVTGRGADERGDERTEVLGGRACTQTRGPREFAGFSSALKKFGCSSSAVQCSSRWRSR